MLKKILPLSIAAFLVSVVPAISSGPSRDEAERAMAESLRQRGVSHKLKVDRLHACFPQTISSEWLCLVEYLGRSGKPLVDELVFQRSGEKWTVLPDAEANPLCPSREIAQAALQSLRNDPRLKITEDARSGTFSTTRGLLQDKKGPLRLACTYEIETGRGLELVVTAYAFYQDDRYIIDPDLDVIPK